MPDGMSIHEDILPSPPNTSNRQMSGLFTRSQSSRYVPSEDPFSDPIGSDSENLARKKVDFQLSSQGVFDAPQLSTPDSELPPSLRSLPPSRDCQQRSRPILKQTQSLESVMGVEKLDDTIQANMVSLEEQLESQDRLAIVSAYQDVSNLIKVNSPQEEQEAFKSRIPALQDHIKRDLLLLDGNTDNVPKEEELSLGNLTLSAVKLAVALVWSEQYSSCVTDEFRHWITERAINVLKEHTASKQICLHYMHLLATQTFRPQIINSHNRATRILEVVDQLTDFIVGKAVMSERLLIYIKLIDQSRSTMRNRAALWIKHVIAGLGHNFKEVRTNAITAASRVCSEISAMPGPEPIYKHVRAALAEEVSKDRTLGSFIIARLERMLQGKEDVNQVPQIWTMVIMLANAGASKVESWTPLSSWLRIIQKGFNSSDLNLRIQAFLAWNRLIYLVRPYDASDKYVSILLKPAALFLEKTSAGIGNWNKPTRTAAVTGYCTLLYYSFRPQLSESQYTRMWNSVIVPVMTRKFIQAPVNCDLGCRVLAALFHSSQHTRPWTDKRAHDSSQLEPEGLPAVEFRWIKAKLPAILSIVWLLVDQASFGLDNNLSDQAYVAQMWRNLMIAFKESVSKEVRTTPQAKAAFTAIFAFFNGCDLDSKLSISRMTLLANITISEVGLNTLIPHIGLDECSPVLICEILRAIEPGPKQASQPQVTAMVDVCCQRLSIEFNKSSSSDDQPTTSASRIDLYSQCLQRIPHWCLLGGIKTFSPGITALMDELFDVSDIQEESFIVFSTTVTNLLSELSTFEALKIMQSLRPLLETLPARRGLLDQWHSIAKNDQEILEIERLHAQLCPQVVNEILSARTENIRKAGPSANSPVRATTPFKTARTKVVKLRLPCAKHADSKIDSTPVDDPHQDHHAVKSQMLTARQKEVATRQRSDPILTFSDINSESPRKSSPKRRLAVEQFMTPEIPETPPTNQGDDEDAHPVTPTPKARKQFQAIIRPEVPSSPPSAVDEDEFMQNAEKIISSPIQGDGTDSRLVLEPAEEQFKHKLSHDKILESEINAQQEMLTAPTERDNGKVTMIQEATSSTPQKDNAAEVDAQDHTPEQGSPIQYSDEFDAMAASQLSQSLVEESFSSSRNSVRTGSKRKRDTKTSPESTPSKRRSISPASDTTVKSASVDATSAQPPAPANASPSPSKQMRTRLRSRGQSSQSQSSLSSQKSTASKRGKRRQPESFIIHDEVEVLDVAPGPSPVPVVFAEQPHDTILPIQTSIQPQLITRAPTAEDSPVLSNATDPPALSPLVQRPTVGAVFGQILPSDDPDASAMEDVTLTPPQPKEPIFASSATQIDVSESFNLVTSLQDILSKLNNGVEIDIDLGAVQNLCFQIGMKATEVASRNI